MKKYISIIYFVALLMLLSGCGALGLIGELSKDTENTKPEKIEVSTPNQSGAVEPSAPTKSEKADKSAAPTDLPKDAAPPVTELPKANLPAPIKTETPVKTETLDSEAVLIEYMDSGQWLVDLLGPDIEDEWGLFAGEEPETCELEITNFKIFDFDGDGINELWLEAYEDSVTWSWGMSGFYAVVDGEVKNLIIGQQTGGSLGGDYVVMGYDIANKRHIIMKSGFVSFVDEPRGQITYSSYYDYFNGELRFIAALENTFYVDEKIPREYFVDVMPVSEEEYFDMEARFREPIDPLYYMVED